MSTLGEELTTTDTTEARPLHVFVDDYPSYWVAYDLADLKTYLDEVHGPDSWGGENAYDELDNDDAQEIWCTATGRMASEDDVDAGGCSLIKKTWGEWATLNGRGYMGGAE